MTQRRKRAISLPPDLDHQLTVAAGGNVSAYVAAAVRAQLDRDRIRAVHGEPDPDLYASLIRQFTAPQADRQAS